MLAPASEFILEYFLCRMYVHIYAFTLDFSPSEDLLRTINNFYRLPEVKQLAAENGLDSKFSLIKSLHPIYATILFSIITSAFGT